MTTTLITPTGGRKLPEEEQSVDQSETTTSRGSIVDQTQSSLSGELLWSGRTGKRRASSTGLGFIESGGDDARVDDLL